RIDSDGRHPDRFRATPGGVIRRFAFVGSGYGFGVACCVSKQNQTPDGLVEPRIPIVTSLLPDDRPQGLADLRSEISLVPVLRYTECTEKRVCGRRDGMKALLKLGIRQRGAHLRV